MNNFKNKIKTIGLDYRKEILKIILIIIFDLLLSVALYIFYDSYLYIGIGLVGLLIITIYFNKKYIDLENKLKKKLINDFIEYFSFFRVYIFNGETVYKSIKETIDLASSDLKEYLSNLLIEINNDKTIKPYMNFSAVFNNKIIDEIMISIYEMVENGSNNNYLIQFTKLFEDFKNRINKENETKRINKFDSFINSSLIGSGLIMIILVYGVINLIGEII